VLSQPEAMIAPTFSMLRQFERMLQSLTCRGSFYDGGQV